MVKIETAIERLLFSTVRIEAHTSDGTAHGTGFVFDYGLNTGDRFLFLVTNRHVIKNATSGGFFVTIAENDEPRLGKRLDLHLPEFGSLWHSHPDETVDIAIMPFRPILRAAETRGHTIYFHSIADDLLPTKQDADFLDAFEEVIFIGYPDALYDEANLIPIIRRATTATPPYFDYGGQMQFLIDGSVIPGSSGSPVLICRTGVIGYRAGGVSVGSTTVFLGVVSAVLQRRRDDGQIRLAPIPTRQDLIVSTWETLNLGVVIKSARVVEAARDWLNANSLGPALPPLTN
jgi:hypothetical protein